MTQAASASAAPVLPAAIEPEAAKAEPSFAERLESRKMKLTEDEAKLAAQELLEELPSSPHAHELLEPMPKATSVRNPAPFGETCSHVVGSEWQDIDYRDEGMTWQRQQAIYAPKGIPNFKTAQNIRQFFRVESTAPYFQKLYQVKGSVL